MENMNERLQALEERAAELESLNQQSASEFIKELCETVANSGKTVGSAWKSVLSEGLTSNECL